MTSDATAVHFTLLADKYALSEAQGRSNNRYHGSAHVRRGTTRSHSAQSNIIKRRIPRVGDHVRKINL